MKAVVIGKAGGGLDAWKLVDREAPSPAPGQILVRVHAASLNYRDLMIAKGFYGGPIREGIVALSDGAGEVLSVGEGVTRWRVGDRVVGAYYPTWISGAYRADFEAAGLGIGQSDGVLAETALFDASGVVAIPKGLDYVRASTLPCAAVTAWQALFEGRSRVEPGSDVVVQGSGGVSLFAAQLAKAAGARVIATTSRNDKVERLRGLGVDDVIVTTTHPEWQTVVLERTAGRGADLVIDVGGAQTLARSFQAAKVSGRVAVVGLLGGMGDAVDPLPILFRGITVEGVHVGSVEMLERLVRAIEVSKLEPVVDSVFALDEAPRALAKLASGVQFGKIVVRVVG